jgi:hypothetical protein
MAAGGETMTDSFRAFLRVFVFVLVVLSLVGPGEAAKKFKERPSKGQAGLHVVNRESAEAHGLVVNLSKKAIVVTDPTTGFAGPFQNIRGSGSQTITFSNARPPIAPATDDDGGFDLTFRSYKAKLAVKSYYWIDARGKRIGKKHKA